MSMTHFLGSVQKGSFFGEVVRWFGVRLAIYVIVALGSVGLFVSYAAFRTFVWPGAPTEQSTPVKTLPSEAPALIPIPQNLPRSPVNPSGPLVAEAGNASFVVVKNVPSKWNISGTPVSDARGVSFGEIIGVDIDPKSRREDIIVRVFNGGDKPIFLTFPVDLISWKEIKNVSSPTQAWIPYEAGAVNDFIKMTISK